MPVSCSFPPNSLLLVIKSPLPGPNFSFLFLPAYHIILGNQLDFIFSKWPNIHGLIFLSTEDILYDFISSNTSGSPSVLLFCGSKDLCDVLSQPLFFFSLFLFMPTFHFHHNFIFNLFLFSFNLPFFFFFRHFLFQSLQPFWL